MTYTTSRCLIDKEGSLILSDRRFRSCKHAIWTYACRQNSAILCDWAVVRGCMLYAKGRRVRCSNRKLAIIVLAPLAALPMVEQPYQPRKKGAALFCGVLHQVDAAARRDPCTGSSLDGFCFLAARLHTSDVGRPRTQPSFNLLREPGTASNPREPLLLLFTFHFLLVPAWSLIYSDSGPVQ